MCASVRCINVFKLREACPISEFSAAIRARYLGGAPHLQIDVRMIVWWRLSNACKFFCCDEDLSHAGIITIDWRGSIGEEFGWRLGKRQCGIAAMGSRAIAAVDAAIAITLEHQHRHGRRPQALPGADTLKAGAQRTAAVASDGHRRRGW